MLIDVTVRAKFDFFINYISCENMRLFERDRIYFTVLTIVILSVL